MPFEQNKLTPTEWMALLESGAIMVVELINPDMEPSFDRVALLEAVAIIRNAAIHLYGKPAVESVEYDIAERKLADVCGSCGAPIKAGDAYCAICSFDEFYVLKDSPEERRFAEMIRRQQFKMRKVRN